MACWPAPSSLLSIPTHFFCPFDAAIYNFFLVSFAIFIPLSLLPVCLLLPQSPLSFIPPTTLSTDLSFFVVAGDLPPSNLFLDIIRH